MAASGGVFVLERLFTVGETANVLHVSKSTVRRLITSGDIEAVRVSTAVRILPESVDRVLKQRYTAPEPREAA